MRAVVGSIAVVIDCFDCVITRMICMMNSDRVCSAIGLNSLYFGNAGWRYFNDVVAIVWLCSVNSPLFSFLLVLG